MSKIISKADDGVRLELTCDGDCKHVPPLRQQFIGAWYPTLASLAVKSGWKLTSERDLCPSCSGKKVRP